MEKVINYMTSVHLRRIRRPTTEQARRHEREPGVQRTRWRRIDPRQPNLRWQLMMGVTSHVIHGAFTGSDLVHQCIEQQVGLHMIDEDDLLRATLYACRRVGCT